jgi:hypothetical protein
MYGALNHPEQPQTADNRSALSAFHKHVRFWLVAGASPLIRSTRNRARANGEGDRCAQAASYAWLQILGEAAFRGAWARFAASRALLRLAQKDSPTELNIDILCANSPQAKGRVERAFGTLQDRLVKELRLAGISTVEAANAWLSGFVEDYNKRFGRAPANAKDLHRP